MALSQPRTEVESSSSDEEGEVGVDEELEQLDSPAQRMYHKSMVFQQDQKRIREDVTKHKRSTFRIPVRCTSCCNTLHVPVLRETLVTTSSLLPTCPSAQRNPSHNIITAAHRTVSCLSNTMPHSWRRGTEALAGACSLQYCKVF